MGQEALPEPELKTKLSTVAPPGLPMGIKLGLAGVAVLAVVAAYLVFRTPKPSTPPPPPPATTSGEEGRRIDVELRALHLRVDAPVGLEQFGAAIGMLMDARKIRTDRAWVDPIDQRIRALREEAENRYQEVKAQAVQARSRGAVAEVDKIKARVAQWGMTEIAETLDRDLAAVRVAAPLPPGGLRLVPASPDGGRVQRRQGVMMDGGVEAVQFGTVRHVGFEGDLFQAPSDGEVQLTFVTESSQSVQIRLRIIGERGQTVSLDYTIRNAAAGKPVQVTAPFRQFTDAGVRGLPAGSIVKQLHVSGLDSKVALRVTQLVVVKRRD